jgi:hypothetical protein
MSNIGGLRLPRDKHLRPRRPIAGLDGYAVTQAGQIWIDEYQHLDTDWAGDYFYGEHDDQVIKIHTREAAAAAWLTADQRAEIRAALPEPIQSEEGHEKLIAELIQRFAVAKWVLFHLSQSAEGTTEVWTVDSATTDGTEIFTRKNVNIADYRTSLIEAYRPPTKGGYATALHLHHFRVGEEEFYFIARGMKKLIFKDDRVSFSYKVDAQGGLKLLRKSLRTLDAKGNHVKRGKAG